MTIKYRLTNVTVDDWYTEHISWEDAAKEAERIDVGRWTSKHEFTLDHPYLIRAVRVE